MPEKQPTLEELAQIEAAAHQRREQMRKDYEDGQVRLAKELPERFFVLAKQVREGVRRFNTAAPIQRPLVYEESAAVTVRDPNLNGDFNLTVKRAPNTITVALRQMARTGRGDYFLIEGQGVLGIPPFVDRFRLRCDAVVRGGETVYRVLVDGKPLDSPIDELGDRLVMVVVTGQLARLWNVAPWVGDRVSR